MAVASRLTMARSAPACLAMTGKDAAGCTTRDEPTTTKTSAASLHTWACCIAAWGMGWPKEMVPVLSRPLHASQRGEVNSSPRLASTSSGSKILPQPRHTTVRSEPCNSTILWSETPPRLCRPSMFWVMRPSSLPRFSKSLMEVWPMLGLTSL